MHPIVEFALGIGVICICLFALKPKGKWHTDRFGLALFLTTVIFSSILVIYNLVYSLLNY